MPQEPLSHPLPVGTENVKVAVKAIIVEGVEIPIAIDCTVENTYVNEENGAIHYDFAAGFFNPLNSGAATVQLKMVSAELVIL